MGVPKPQASDSNPNPNHNLNPNLHNSKTTTQKPPSTSESIQGPPLPLERIHHIHGCHRLPPGMLRVGHRIANHVLQEDLEHSASLLIDQAADSLDVSSSCQSPSRRLHDSLNVVVKNLAMPLRSSLSAALTLLWKKSVIAISHRPHERLEKSPSRSSYAIAVGVPRRSSSFSTLASPVESVAGSTKTKNTNDVDENFFVALTRRLSQSTPYETPKFTMTCCVRDKSELSRVQGSQKNWTSSTRVIKYKLQRTRKPKELEQQS
ncbi:histone H4 [Senna tora]|uniref:Histone H4 n=1 Tax=Senna tora TaxID=362788 RepID=A0A834W0X5_9FABA|nr:histone H4 [Senna tora]